MSIPYRVELCGCYMECEIINRHCTGKEIVLSIEPERNYMYRGGLASSTRNIAKALWGDEIPPGDLMTLAKELNKVECSPTSLFPSGAGDAIGVVVPGCSLLRFKHSSWPEDIERLTDTDTLQFLRDHIYLYPLHPRDPDVHPYYHSVIDYSAMRDELESVELCWESIKNKDIKGIGDSFNACYDAQTRLFPLIENEDVRPVMNWLREQCYGCKMTGAGTGGYCIIAADKPIGRSIQFTPVGLK